MTALKRIEREPLWDLAHTQLQDALLAGRFQPGTVLTLRSLAESFGTSITPVRALESGFSVPGQARDIQRVRTRSGPIYIVSRNNDRPLVFSAATAKKSAPAGAGAE